MSRSTEKLELVETHNLAISLKRLNSGDGGNDSYRWKIALYHAVLMAELMWGPQATKLREALELP